MGQGIADGAALVTGSKAACQRGAKRLDVRPLRLPQFKGDRLPLGKRP